MARKKKPPFEDEKGKWYAVLGKRKPRPFSERALRKALKDIEQAKEEKQKLKVKTPAFVEKLADALCGGDIQKH